jgi:hypothetical protein
MCSLNSMCHKLDSDVQTEHNIDMGVDAESDAYTGSGASYGTTATSKHTGIPRDLIDLFCGSLLYVSFDAVFSL